MKGIVCSQSVFRDMIREMGSNSFKELKWIWVDKDFLPVSVLNYLHPLSKSIANLIKTNKAKLKYNSYVFLIDEKQLKDSQNQQKIK